MSTKRTSLQERYELGEVLGRGGMGIVYKAYDTLMKRHVALKTILELDNLESIQLFYKEWSLLATMVHPNVISIYDIGEFAQGAVKKPFFVMPLLPGSTLDKLIKDGGPAMTVPGVLGIIGQACRGLHAAHEQGLVHRDIKPSNIFVMDDHSVKIIDFGIARGASANSRTMMRGTLHYMAPEQFDMKPASPLSDLFALGVVTYEALTRHRPFQGASDNEIIAALQKRNPPPVSELNPDAGYAISQVVNKAIAKKPSSRFSSVREFGEALEKAMRNEPLDYFSTVRIKPRLDRAKKSFEQGDYDFASEVLSELEMEGQLDPDISTLRGRLEQAMRQIQVQQLVDCGRRFFEASEYSLATRKIQEAIELDPANTAALALKEQVDKQRQQQKIGDWMAEARRHVRNGDFREAGEALDNVLKLNPGDAEALAMLPEVRRQEQAASEARDESERLYEAAWHAWERGETTSALSQIEALLAADPASDRSDAYRSFRDQLLSEREASKRAYEEARRNLSSGDFEAALAICRQWLSKHPGHALFKALQVEVEDGRRQNRNAVIAATDQRVELEPDLDKRVAILEEALRVYAGETHFERALQLARDKRDMVNSIAAKARFFEERGQLDEALEQWRVLGSIHPEQPGLASEIERLNKRRSRPPSPPPPSPPPPPAVEPPVVEPPAGEPRVVSQRPKRLVYGAAAGIALLAVLASVAYRHSHQGPAAAGAGGSKVNLRAFPAGAAISVDGKPCGSSGCEIELPPGSHRAEASLDGYQTATSEFQLLAAPLEINLTLQPVPGLSAPPSIAVSTDLTEAAVLLDDAPAGQIQSGELELPNLAPGKHRLSLQSGAFQASVPIEISPGAIPKVDGPMKTAGLKALVVARAGAEARIYSSVDGSRVNVDGKPAGIIVPDGLGVTGLAPGPHEVVLDAPSGAHQKIAFDSGPSSRLLASFSTDGEVGVLRIVADDGATVYLNGEKYRRTTSNGRLLVYLTPKQYTVRVEKEAFATPPEQVATLKLGEETKLEFKLLPARASLSVRNSVPGTEVWLDGARLGAVRPDGSFSSDVDPGKHVVLLKSEYYKPIQAERLFAVGKPVEVDGKLESAVGILKIEINPPGKGTRLRLRRQGAPDREIAETALSLPEGAYTITASTPQYQDGSVAVQVTANRAVTASLVLKPVEKVPERFQERSRTFTMADWEKTGGWTRDGSDLTRRGGDFVLAPAPFGPGTIMFTVQSRHGKRLEWVLNFRDTKNYCLFQLDDKNFTRSEVVNGKRIDGPKISHGASRKEFIGIGILVTARAIQHRILRAGQWLTLDTWDRPGTQGSFGFHLPGKDEIALSDFRFTPE